MNENDENVLRVSHSIRYYKKKFLFIYSSFLNLSLYPQRIQCITFNYNGLKKTITTAKC